MNPYLKSVLRLRKTIPTWDRFFRRDEEEERSVGWVRLEVLGQPMVDKYAWAIPDERSLRIIAHFSPLIEVSYCIYSIVCNGYNLIAAHLLITHHWDIVCSVASLSCAIYYYIMMPMVIKPTNSSLIFFAFFRAD
ncbi:hypothetical protein EON64_09970 [archaeon]|nr:MAG: hypothetical protein EON64_09970 [archaeon]